MAGEPATDVLWTVANERDELGDDLVPDDLTSVRYGGVLWLADTYYGQNVDVRVEPPRPTWWRARSRRTTRWARTWRSLGLAYSDGNALPARFSRTACSWASTARGIGSRRRIQVVFMPFMDGQPAGPA